MNKNISKFGTILKRETLASAKLSLKHQQLILLSNDPFPGYYCAEEMPADNSCKEISYYVPIKEQGFRDVEDFCRVSLEMQERTGVMICPAMFNFEETHIHAFRIKGVTEEQLLDNIELLGERNMTFFPHKKVTSFLSYISLKAFFELRQIGENLYKNLDSEGLYYFTSPERVEWEKFEQIITYQKSNSRFRNFDAAIGYWVEKPKFLDFIRIYGNDLDREILESIRNDFAMNYRNYKRAGMLL